MADTSPNRLLLASGEGDRKRILERCEHLQLHVGEVLTEGGQRQDTIYFPSSGVVSTIASYSDGTSIEIATTGREGCIGIGPLLSGERALATDLVQIAGEADVLDLADYLDLLGELPVFRATLLSFTQAYVYQLIVSAACNGVHSLRQRLARWLLMTDDRCGGRELGLTQEFLATALGVQRPSLTIEARSLQEAGLIEYRRGKLTILDKAGLEEVSCECYRLVRETYSVLLPCTYS